MPSCQCKHAFGRSGLFCKYAGVRRFVSVSMRMCGGLCFQVCSGTQHLLCRNSCSNWRWWFACTYLEWAWKALGRTPHTRVTTLCGRPVNITWSGV